ncbi:MAG: hypothetical protein QGF53_15660 [Alphaproteobacteria bacterium]|jgi:hypothetical protein|nr:hypothetical protein [Alphaproteobacteria bacterium]
MTKGLVAMAATLVLAACQASVPGAAKISPPADHAMASPVADIEAVLADTTAARRDGESGCDIRVYRATGGHAYGEALCGEESERVTGTWSVLGGGAYCEVWDDDGWGSGCYDWQHTGGGSYDWQRTSGNAPQAAGSSQVYAGNPLGL